MGLTRRPGRAGELWGACTGEGRGGPRAEEEGEGDDSEGGLKGALHGLSRVSLARGGGGEGRATGLISPYRGTPYVSMISWKAEVTLLTRK